MNLTSRATLKMLAERFRELFQDAIHRFAHLINTENVTGDHIENSRNCSYCSDLAGEAENVKYCHWGTYGLKDSYDTGPGTGGKSELTYEGISIGVSNSRCAFGAIVWWCRDALYALGCDTCSNIFGCVSLRGKEYCILNKQYTKKEYEELLPKIKQHMKDMPYTDTQGRVYAYGEFFPAEIAPWAYNETVAQDYFPLTSQTAQEHGYKWRDEEDSTHTPTLQGSELPDTIEGVDESILKEVIACEETGKSFRIVQQELDFYKKMNLPLPTRHPDVRHRIRLERRNPYRLWQRRAEDGTLVWTTFAPNRSEKIYSDEAYKRLIL